MMGLVIPLPIYAKRNPKTELGITGEGNGVWECISEGKCIICMYIRLLCVIGFPCIKFDGHIGWSNRMQSG